jgi:3-oxoacyl-[acyl-carrier protein] reductase
MDLSIKGKTAVVTASSDGLGFASAMVLAQEGANVVINSSNLEKLKKAADKIRQKTGVEVIEVPGDITLQETSKLVIGQAFEHFGGVEILVANAPGPPAKPALDVNDDDVDLAINNNFKSTLRLTNAVLPYMIKKNYGRIVAIASSSIVQAIVSLPLSNSARIALWAWVKTAAYELGEKDLNVTINLVCPGSHSTARIRQLGITGRLGDPMDFGAVVAFLCSGQARFINGARVVVDGGATLAL